MLTQKTSWVLPCVSYRAKLINTSDSVTVKFKKGTDEVKLGKDFENVDSVLKNDNSNYFFEVHAEDAPDNGTGKSK